MQILALDVGSSSVKAALWNVERSRAVGRVRVAYRTQFDGLKAEIRPEQLLRAVRQAGKNAVADRGTHVDAVCFCAFSSGVVITAADGTPRTPIITHADRRSVDVARTLVERHGKRWWLTRTGNLPYPGGIGSSTLAWLRQHSPAVFRGRYCAGQVSSLIGRMLTGRWTTDRSQSVFLGLWDLRRNAWSAEVCRAVGVEVAALPEVQWADQSIGTLEPRLARHWGIIAGTPVIGGFVDTSAAVIQTPMSAGQLAHNTGSTDVLAMCLDTPHPADGILTRPVGVGRVYEQKWLAVRTIAASGSALQWARATFFRELKEPAWNRTLAHACKGLLPSANSPLECLPTLAGERAAIEQSVGATFRGFTLGTSREDLLRALATSLAARSAADYARLCELHPPNRKVFAMGAAGTLADLMHRTWPGKHTFARLQGDSLAGLGELARRTLTASPQHPA